MTVVMCECVRAIVCVCVCVCVIGGGFVRRACVRACVASQPSPHVRWCRCSGSCWRRTECICWIMCVYVCVCVCVCVCDRSWMCARAQRELLVENAELRLRVNDYTEGLVILHAGSPQ